MNENEIKEYIEGTQELLTKTAATAEVYAKNAPIVAEKLIALGLIQGNSKQAAINSLQSPELVFSTLNKLLDSTLAANTRPSPGRLGTPEKSANVATPKDGKKESDKVWESHFLINK